MFFLSITFVTWAIIWIIILLYTPEGGLQKSPASPLTLSIFLWYHIITICLLIVFYYRNYSRLKKIRWDTSEQQGFACVGIFAAFANIRINTLSSTFGTQHLPLFISCTIQNTLLYVGIVLFISIIDCWDMSDAKKKSKLWVLILFCAQFVINGAQIVITVGHYANSVNAGNDNGLLTATPLNVVAVTLYRSWLVYFGTWKMNFLYRKSQRWDCGVFVYSTSYQLLSHEIENSFGRKGFSFTDIMIYEDGKENARSDPVSSIISVEDSIDEPLTEDRRVKRALMHVRSSRVFRMPTISTQQQNNAPMYRVLEQEQDG